MARNRKYAGDKEWIVPVKQTFRGEVIVNAASAVEAEALCGGGDLEPGAELVDWECTGRARENV